MNVVVGLMEGALVGGTLGGATGILLVNRAGTEVYASEWILSSSVMGGAAGGAGVGAWHEIDINWNAIGPKAHKDSHQGQEL